MPIPSYRGISQQGTAVRGGITARVPQYRSAPIAPRSIAADYDEPDPKHVDMSLDDEGVYSMARRSLGSPLHESDMAPFSSEPVYSPSSDLRASLDDYSAGRATDIIGSRVGSGLTSGLFAAGVGAEPSQALEIGLKGLVPGPMAVGSILGTGVVDSVAKSNLMDTYDPILGNTPRKTLDMYDAVNFQDIEDPTETFAPEEMGRYEARRSMLDQYDDMTRSLPEQIGTSSLGKLGIIDDRLHFWERPRVPTHVQDMLGVGGNEIGPAGLSGFDLSAEPETEDEKRAWREVAYNLHGPALKIGRNVYGVTDRSYDFMRSTPPEERTIWDKMMAQDPSNAAAMLHSPTQAEYLARRAEKLDPLFGGGTDMRGRDGGQTDSSGLGDYGGEEAAGNDVADAW